MTSGCKFSGIGMTNNDVFFQKKNFCTGWLIWIINRHIFYKLFFSLNPGSVMDSWLVGNDVSSSVSTDISWPILIPNSSFWRLSQGQDQNFDMPLKRKSDICTIMYTSGTTGDPKGVMISNQSIITLIAGVKRLLESVNEKVSGQVNRFMRRRILEHYF